MRHALALGQGLYYLAAGVWALVSIRSFEAVTGPKTDRWLVKTVGVLVSVIGVVLALAGWRRRVELEPALLAAGSAAGLAAIDTVYATKSRISKIYRETQDGERHQPASGTNASRRRAPYTRPASDNGRSVAHAPLSFLRPQPL